MFLRAMTIRSQRNEVKTTRFHLQPKVKRCEGPGRPESQVSKRNSSDTLWSMRKLRFPRERTWTKLQPAVGNLCSCDREMATQEEFFSGKSCSINAWSCRPCGLMFICAWFVHAKPSDNVQRAFARSTRTCQNSTKLQPTTCSRQ